MKWWDQIQVECYLPYQWCLALTPQQPVSQFFKLWVETQYNSKRDEIFVKTNIFYLPVLFKSWVKKGLPFPPLSVGTLSILVLQSPFWSSVDKNRSHQLPADSSSFYRVVPWENLTSWVLRESIPITCSTHSPIVSLRKHSRELCTFLFVCLFNWSIVELQCCITYHHTAKWLRYIYM